MKTYKEEGDTLIADIIVGEARKILKKESS
jgi:hypothetical protein